MILHPSPNYNDRPAGARVKYLILHYTGMATGGAALKRLCDPTAKVSAHYLIEEDGRVYSLVVEDKRAWHAGVAAWEADRDINGLSIGVELVNPGHDAPGYQGDYRPFPEPQMAALIKLCRGILARHAIRPWYVLGHSDVAPARKIDPGELFDWRRLAAQGIGAWHNVSPDRKIAPSGAVSVAEVQEMLARYGYPLARTGWADQQTRQALSAFQRHFRPADFSGEPDPETQAILRNLLARKASV